MCTTLHLLLGDRHPHEVPDRYITRALMLNLHMNSLDWFIAGTPPALWQIGYTYRGILPPAQVHTRPYTLLSITATTSLPKGQTWRPELPTNVGPPSTTTPTPLQWVTGPSHPNTWNSLLRPGWALLRPRNRLGGYIPTLVLGSIITGPQSRISGIGTLCSHCSARTPDPRASEPRIGFRNESNANPGYRHRPEEEPFRGPSPTQRNHPHPSHSS